MRYNLKARLAMLGKRNVDVIEELGRRGVNTNPCQFSDAISGRRHTPKYDLIAETADKIVSEWETEIKHR